MIARALLFLALIALPSIAQAKLSYQVIRASEHSFNANSVLLKGEKKAILVDAPFTRADAHRVVAAILDTGLELETIFITHNHPDHYYSAEVIRAVFPKARFVAHPEVVKAIWHSLPYKQARWTKQLGDNGPQSPTAPAPLEGYSLTLEGEDIQILGPMQGDHAANTVLWVPSIKALFASDMIHNQVVLWFVEHDATAVKAYAASIEKLAALKPEIIVPGHERPGLKHDASALIFTRSYLAAWQRLAPKAKNAEELVQMIKREFPDAVDPNGDFALRTGARAAKGEEPRWEE